MILREKLEENFSFLKAKIIKDLTNAKQTGTKVIEL